MSVMALSATLQAHASSVGNEKPRSKAIVNQTGKIVKEAFKIVKAKQTYNGYLAKAVAHQHVAMEYYEKGSYLQAIYFSRRARWFAIRAIQTNGGVVPADSGYLDSDALLFKDSPVDDELDYLLVKEHSSEKLLDEEIIDSKLKVEVK